MNHQKLFLHAVGLFFYYSCAALHVSRRELLYLSSVAPFINKRHPDTTLFPLQFLPIGGCWALKITVSDQMNDWSYLAIVDTGSPFLTAPAQHPMAKANNNTQFPTTVEQYGELSGEMLWQKADYVTLLTEQGVIFEKRDIVLGVPSSQVIEQQTIFVGLIWKDDNRPTFLQQFGIQSMCMDFVNNQLTLSRNHVLQRSDTYCALYDLRPFGPDLYHYAVLCDAVELQYVVDDNNNTIRTMSLDSLRRPIVAVLETGLTGCIVSNSLQTEIPSLQTILGACITIKQLDGKRIQLSSCEQYWRLSSFRLPWFYNENQHPHIIAMGNTFWKNTRSLTIDPGIGRFKVEL